MEIQVNGKTAEARPGEMLLQTLRRSGVHVPTLCHMEGLLPSGACRLCVVEVEGAPGLVPSCAAPVREGMKVRTHSLRAVRARKTIVELLLANHPDDCLYCARNNDCTLQGLAADLGVRRRRYTGARDGHHIDSSSPAIVRDPAKCILCGKCVRVCEEVQGVAAVDFTFRGPHAQVSAAFGEGLNVSSCVQCGQCIQVCPTGALTEQSHFRDMLTAIDDPETTVVVQVAPAVSVTLSEHFGLPAGTDAAGLVTAALRRLRVDRVFETSFAADVTVMEEASELVERVKHGGALPLMTSCSPGWVKYVEQFHPDFIPNLSTCKSPQQMLGALVKGWWAQKEGLDPAKVFSVSVMPCTAKKFEASRPEMMRNGLPDVDLVLTTRELARLLRMRGIDLASLEPQPPDDPFGERSGAAKLFGATGGVMEAALRTAHHLLTGRELADPVVAPVRGMDGVRAATVDVDGLQLEVAVASGLGNAARLMEEVRAGRRTLHFLEVMTCPGGCVNGGGQPLGAGLVEIRHRMQALQRIDGAERLRTAHANPSVKKLYDEFLGAPLGERSHELLHAHWSPCEVVR